MSLFKIPLIGKKVYNKPYLLLEKVEGGFNMTRERGRTLKKEGIAKFKLQRGDVIQHPTRKFYDGKNGLYILIKLGLGTGDYSEAIIKEGSIKLVGGDSGALWNQQEFRRLNSPKKDFSTFAKQVYAAAVSLLSILIIAGVLMKSGYI